MLLTDPTLLILLVFEPFCFCTGGSFRASFLTLQVAVGENKAHKNQILAEKVQNLWRQVSAQRKVDLEWVQGHTGDTGNEAWISTLRFDLEILSAAE